MIAIAICDDSDAVVSSLNNFIMRYTHESGQNIKVYKYSSGFQLLDRYAGNYDIIFLDIKMPEMTGLEAAAQIRKRDRKVSIIFLTSLVQYALEGYKVDALNYIIKPMSYKRLKMELDAWFHKQEQETAPFLIIKNDNGSYKVLLKELVYIETSNRNALVHTKKENIVCYKKLKILEEDLKYQGFSCCHSSYIVNLAFVDSVEKTDAKLITGAVIPISQTRRKQFMQSLARFWGEKV